MARDFARAFYNSDQWQRARRFVLGRSGGLCERCFEKGIIRAADVVHHIIFLTPKNVSDPRISLNPEKLIALCQDCHAEVHSSKTKRRYKVDREGNVIPFQEEDIPPVRR